MVAERSMPVTRKPSRYELGLFIGRIVGIANQKLITGGTQAILDPGERIDEDFIR